MTQNGCLNTAEAVDHVITIIINQLINPRILKLTNEITEYQ